MRRIVICSLIFLLMGSFGISLMGQKDVPSDEIIQLKQEIRRLKVLVLQLARVLPEEQRIQFSEIIAQMEKELKEKQRKEKYSDTTRKVNKVKLEIEKVKEDLKEKSGGIAFSGFFDVTASGYKNNPNVYALGDFELDLEKIFGENFQVGAALVFNDDGAELAVGFIDFHLFGGPIAARGRLFSERGLHFQVGRFDVPFGNDWQYFAAADRVSVSAPLTTEQVMEGGYNDVGLRILRAAITYNYTFFMLRGIEEGFSMGGRFGFTPFNNPYTFKKKQLQALELGVSYMHDFDRDGNREERSFAVDFESKISPAHLQGEYLRRDYDIEAIRMEGYHISAFFDFSQSAKLPLTLFGRYDYAHVRPFAVDEKDRLSRFTVGVNINLFDISALKIEYLDYIKENDKFFGSSFYAQLVIAF